MQSLDEARRARIVVERRAYLSYADLEHAFADYRVGPDCFDELLLCDELAGTPDYKKEHREFFWRERNLPLITPQALIDQIQPKSAKDDLFFGHVVSPGRLFKIASS